MSVQSKIQHQMMPRFGSLGELNLNLEYSFKNNTAKKIAFLNRTACDEIFWYHATLKDGSIKRFNQTNIPEEVIYKDELVALLKIVMVQGNTIALSSDGYLCTKSRGDTIYNKISLNTTEETTKVLDFLIFKMKMIILTSKQEIITMALDVNSLGKCTVDLKTIREVETHESMHDIRKMVSLDDKVYFLKTNGELIGWIFGTSAEYQKTTIYETTPIDIFGKRVKDIASSPNHLLALTEDCNLYTLDYGTRIWKELKSLVNGKDIRMRELYSTDKIVIAVSEDDDLYPLNCFVPGKLFNYLRKELLLRTILELPNLKDKAQDLPYVRIVKVVSDQVAISLEQICDFDEDKEIDPALCIFYGGVNSERIDIPRDVYGEFDILLDKIYKDQNKIHYIEEKLNEYQFRDSGLKIWDMVNLFIEDQDLKKASIPFPVAINCNSIIKRLLKLTNDQRSELYDSAYKIIHTMLEESNSSLKKMINLMRPNYDGSHPIILKLKELFNAQSSSNFELKIKILQQNDENIENPEFKSIYVNSTYLSILSPHMKSIFVNHWPIRVGDTQILISDHKYSAFHDYILYLHTGIFENRDNVPDIYEISHSHLDENMKSDCLDNMFTFITPEKCIAYYQLIDFFKDTLQDFEEKVDRYVENKILADIEIPPEVKSRFLEGKLGQSNVLEDS